MPWQFQTIERTGSVVGFSPREWAARVGGGSAAGGSRASAQGAGELRSQGHPAPPCMEARALNSDRQTVSSSPSSYRMRNAKGISASAAPCSVPPCQVESAKRTLTRVPNKA